MTGDARAGGTENPPAFQFLRLGISVVTAGRCSTPSFCRPIGAGYRI